MDMEWTSQPSMLGQMVLHRDAVAVDVGRKGVARLVGDHLHIALGAVEVGEDEGHARSRGCWCSSRRRSLPSVDSTSSSSPSSIVSEELAGLGGELVVELPALRQDLHPGVPTGRGLPERNSSALSAKLMGYCLPSRLACSR